MCLNGKTECLPSQRRYECQTALCATAWQPFLLCVLRFDVVISLHLSGVSFPLWLIDSDGTLTSKNICFDWS